MRYCLEVLIKRDAEAAVNQTKVLSVKRQSYCVPAHRPRTYLGTPLTPPAFRPTPFVRHLAAVPRRPPRPRPYSNRLLLLVKELQPPPQPWRFFFCATALHRSDAQPPDGAHRIGPL